MFGKRYKKYTSKYEINKRSGNLKGIDGKPQERKFKESNAPVLTGDLYRDYIDVPRMTGSGFEFGFATRGGVVRQLSKMGRVVSSNSKPIPDPVANYIMREANKYVKKSS